MTGRTYDHLARLAHAHLDDAATNRWLALLRPAVQLRPDQPGDTVVARLGGTPALPPDVPWPEWPGFGPLRFVAEVDLAALASTGLDAGLALPTDGRWLTFYFDDPEAAARGVYADDEDSLLGFRLLHVSGTAPTPDPAVELSGVQVLTWPGWEHPVLDQHRLDELSDPFDEALGELLETELGPDVWGHHFGGWANPVQGPVEFEAAATRIGQAAYSRADLGEAFRWRPLLQVDSDDTADTCWGDAGCLYWLRANAVPDPHAPYEESVRAAR